MKDLKDKVAVVTGGASGIGRAIGLALSGKGTHVIVSDVDLAAAEETAAELAEHGVTSMAVACDVAKLEDVEALADRAWSELGHVDLVFNNAGVGGGTFLLDSDPRELHWIFSVNVFGVWHGCSVFGRRFRDQGTPAWIVNTGSEHSLGMPHVQAGFYTATKHAVLALSDVLRKELPDFIGVSILCPGVVHTNFWDAKRHRPAEYGGAEAGRPEVKAIMERGKDALEIGRKAVEGVERGDFFIVTHPHARRYVDDRYREIASAFEAQAPFTEGEDRYDVTTIALEVARGLVEPGDR